MKTTFFLIVIIISGISAGIIHGLFNLVFVEPFLDKAISIENQDRISSGEIKDTSQFMQDFYKYRQWQKQGSILSGAILGLATGSLFGVVLSYTGQGLPGKNYVKKALILGGIMWLTIFLIPFLKYPANPPTVGDPNTIAFRSLTYIIFLLICGGGTLGFAIFYKRIYHRKKFLVIIGYSVYMAAAFFAMPPNPDKIIAPMDLLYGFRIASLGTMTIFWFTNSLILGLLWEKFLTKENRP